jgi:AcrR family transcriptional regulator
MVTPSRTIAPKRDKEYRQQTLIDAGTTVFAEHGYDCATTREIADRAGCSEGLIHRYFSGKRGLLLAILEDRGAHVAESFNSDLPDRDTVAEELEQLHLWYLEMMWERRDFMRVAVSQAAIDPTIGRTIGESINRVHAALIIDKLRRHQAAGRIRPDADLSATAFAISGLGFAIGFVFQTCFGEDRGLARRIMLDAAAALTRGLTEQ